jgi:hypothetical protein
MFSFASIQPETVRKQQPEKDIITGRFKIQKADDDKRLAFGWAYVSQDTAGNQTEDHSGDQLEPEDLEKAAYQFVKLYREGGEMHERGGCAVLVESMIFTKEKQQALGIPDGTLPVGWWIGFEVTDDDVWAKVKDGTYPMFSIEGTALRVPIEEAGDGGGQE